MRLVVIGSGAMGLAAAYQAVTEGHDVVVLEAAPDPGGMAGHFDFDGISIERFYHFVCKTDQPTFVLMSELEFLTRCGGDPHPWAFSPGIGSIDGATPWRSFAIPVSI